MHSVSGNNMMNRSNSSPARKERSMDTYLQPVGPQGWVDSYRSNRKYVLRAKAPTQWLRENGAYQ